MEGNYNYQEGIHVLKLDGDDYEMGFKHGSLLKSQIGQGVLPYFSKFVKHNIAESVGKLPAQVISALTNGYLSKRLYNNFPNYVKDGFRGLADGAELSPKTIRQAITMPEIFLWIVSRNVKMKSFTPAWASPVVAPTLGCSSVAAFGSATKENEVLYARNLDYPGIGTWDKHHVMTFYSPKDSHSYGAITSAGILYGGITAMNDQGLCIGVHQHLTCDQSKLSGMPVGIVGDQIMRYANNLEDAKKILDEHTPNACFTYMITSGKEKAILCYEVTPTGRAHFFEDSTFAYTNFYLNKALAKNEYYMYASHWHSNVGRYENLKSKLNLKYGNITAHDCAKMMGDRSDEYCRLSKPIAVLSTVSSAVFRPEKQLIYVANGRAPVSNNDYIPFSLKSQSITRSFEPLNGFSGSADEKIAFSKYREAFEAYDKNNYVHALTILKTVCKLQPNESIYHYITGLTALKIKDLNTSTTHLRKSIEIGHDDFHRLASFHLWLGRCFDLAQNRKDAIASYQSALNGTDLIKKAASKGLKKTWQFKNFAIEYNYADVVNP